jgi:hypothetical protein
MLNSCNTPLFLSPWSGTQNLNVLNALSSPLPAWRTSSILSGIFYLRRGEIFDSVEETKACQMAGRSIGKAWRCGCGKLACCLCAMSFLSPIDVNRQFPTHKCCAQHTGMHRVVVEALLIAIYLTEEDVYIPIQSTSLPEATSFS